MLYNSHKCTQKHYPWCWHHNFTFPHMCSGMACMWLWFYWTSVHHVCQMNTEPHWGQISVWKNAQESSLRPLANPQEQLFMVFISLHVCLHDISLYMCMCQSTVLHPLLELIPQLARRRSRRMKLNVCILHAYLHSDYISTCEYDHF